MLWFRCVKKCWRMQRSNLFFLIVFGVTIVLGFGAFWWASLHEEDTPLQKQVSAVRTFERVQLGERTLEVVLAETAAEQELGLSSRETLGADGMLFPFSEPYIPFFWMNQMEFALDFVWIANGVVVDMHENVPAPLPQSSEIVRVSPRQKVDAVLELPAGFIAAHGITMGTPFSRSGEVVDKVWESSKLLQE